MHNYEVKPSESLALDRVASDRVLRGEPRLATALLGARIEAGERSESVEKSRRTQRPADRLGGAQRRGESRVRLLGDQVDEAPGAAREAPGAARNERRDLDQPVIAAARCARALDHGQSSARSTSRALTGFIAI
jgi:hypothetical protein